MHEITVIITAWKDRGWINEAILSAKDQTFTDYDIIFVSDGNPWLEAYATDNNIPFRVYPKGNYSTLVNNAVRDADARWIKILHDDDLLTPNCLTDLYEAGTDADLVYANAMIFNDDDKENAMLYRPPDHIDFRSLMPIISNPVNFEAELFRKDIFLEAGGFDPYLGYAEDYELLLNFLTRGFRIKYCDSTVVWYRHHDRQITGNEPAMRAREQDYLLKKYMDQVVKHINW